MEEISTEVLMQPEQRTTKAPPPTLASYYQSPCDLVAGVISAVLRCLGLGPFGSNNHQNSFIKGTQDLPSASELGMKTSQDDAVQLKAEKGRSPKKPPISPGKPPQHN